MSSKLLKIEGVEDLVKQSANKALAAASKVERARVTRLFNTAIDLAKQKDNKEAIKAEVAVIKALKEQYKELCAAADSPIGPALATVITRMYGALSTGDGPIKPATKE